MKKRKQAALIAKHDVESMPNHQIVQIAKAEKKNFLIGTVLISICAVVMLIGAILCLLGNEMGLGIFALILFSLSTLILILFLYIIKTRDDKKWAIGKIKANYINNPTSLTAKLSLLEQEAEQEELRQKGFAISKYFTCKTKLFTRKLYIDNIQKHFIVLFSAHVTGTENTREYSKIYNFSDIINYEVIENGKKVVQGTAGEALIGGFFFGISGAIAGSNVQKEINDICTDLELHIRVNDFEKPQIVFTFIQGEMCEKSSPEYRLAKSNLQAICAQLEYIINTKTLEQSANTQVQSSTTEKSSKEQLQELKEMLDEGLIKDNDYEQKKKQILGL